MTDGRNVLSQLYLSLCGIAPPAIFVQAVYTARHLLTNISFLVTYMGGVTVMVFKTTILWLFLDIYVGRRHIPSFVVSYVTDTMFSCLLDH